MHKQSQARTDLTAIGLLVVLVFSAAAYLDWFESFVDWSRAHESWQLDELATLAAVLGLAFALYSRRRWNELRAEVRARRRAEREVTLLTGILPICSSCKQVRDDNGDWHPIERFLRLRCDAQFSHGFCPDCVAVLYPEFADRCRQD